MPRTFTLVRTLGRGAHGAVHLAEMRDEDDYVQTLAVKRLLPEWSTDPDLVARLKDEARLLALLQHDHVVRVHGLTRIDGTLAILMEPVDGVDLGRLVARHGALAPRVTLEIVRAVADALDAVWTTAPPGGQALRVVHRDIKPSNVMLTARGGVKVMDFGVARASFDAREGETRSQQFGTARYMAPEQWLHGRAEHESDVFSLGVTLVEIASGVPVPRLRLAADGFAEDRAAALATLDWEPLRELAGRMTEFEPRDRLSAAEVVSRCDALLRDAPGPPLRAWAGEAVVPEPGEPIDPTAPATVVREETAGRSSAGSLVPGTRRSRLGIALGGAALVSGAVFLATRVDRVRGADPSTSASAAGTAGAASPSAAPAGAASPSAAPAGAASSSAAPVPGGPGSGPPTSGPEPAGGLPPAPATVAPAAVPPGPGPGASGPGATAAPGDPAAPATVRPATPGPGSGSRPSLGPDPSAPAAPAPASVAPASPGPGSGRPPIPGTGTPGSGPQTSSGSGPPSSGPAPGSSPADPPIGPNPAVPDPAQLVSLRFFVDPGVVAETDFWRVTGGGGPLLRALPQNRAVTVRVRVGDRIVGTCTIDVGESTRDWRIHRDGSCN